MTYKTYATKSAMQRGLRAAGLAGMKRGWEVVDGRYQPVILCELKQDVIEAQNRGFKAQIDMALFPIGAIVRLKDERADGHKQMAKIERHYTDIEGGVRLEAELNGFVSWNVSDLEVVHIPEMAA